MKILIDTHVLIWYIEGDQQLSPSFCAYLDNPATETWVSYVSLWELTIKNSLNKLRLTLSLAELQAFLRANHFNLLQLDFSHLEVLSTLPFHHGDPFDRFIIAQALSEDLTCMSCDRHFQLYSDLKLLTWVDQYDEDN